MLAREATIAVVAVFDLVFASGALGLDSVLAMIFHCDTIYREKVRVSIFSLERKI
mgnify:CR=1 FL=1